VKDFRASGPNDPHFALDETAGTLHFGNGINGRIVPATSSIDVNYSVSQGLRGNQPANLPWTVTGIAGPFGTNAAPIAGGMDARGLPDLRRLARQRIRTARPVVTAADLESAALAFADLGMTRALELTPHAACRVRGTRILLVVGPHDEGDESTREESAELLSEIHARIAPRLALGQTLDVIAPRYVTVRVRASIVAAPRVDPDELHDNIVDALRRRLAVVPREGGKGWPFGRDLTATTVSGWMRKVEGVAGVSTMTLSSDPPSTSDTVIALGRTALPILDVRNSKIAIERSVHRSVQRSHSEPPR
jgi:predicted phage baseplate assembly protein